jgi:hypothetical protein
LEVKAKVTVAPWQTCGVMDARVKLRPAWRGRKPIDTQSYSLLLIINRNVCDMLQR